MSNDFKISPTLAYVAGGMLVGTLAGFVLGRSTAPTAPSPSKHISLVDSEDDDDEEEEEDKQEGLSGFANSHEEYKMVLVVRTDLGMTKGKIAAQCSHATLACYKTLLREEGDKPGSVLHRWESLGQAKVSVQIKSEDELYELQARAMSLGLCARVVRDAGRTQIASGSATVLGVGPGPKSVVDQITGTLKLL